MSRPTRAAIAPVAPSVARPDFAAKHTNNVARRSSPMDHARTIVIVGGGFAGTTLARELDGRLRRGFEIVLISEESYTTFNPMLPEALGASVFPEQVVAPIRQMVAHARFIMGRVTAIDPA